MAIDSRDKRASSIGWGLAFLTVLPSPNGAIDQGDRQQTAYAYRLAAGAAIVADPQIIAVSFEDRVIRVAAESRVIVVPEAFDLDVESKL